LQLTSIRNSDKIYKLLQLLAHQIGNLVSVHELSNVLGLNHQTVNNYIDLLENGFIIKRLSGLSKNPRKEISKMDKLYFTDLGIRNALIQNFSSIDVRPDKGALWENFLFIERCKYLAYHKSNPNQYFYRRYSGAEIDYIEQEGGFYNAYEFKWSVKKQAKFPLSFLSSYTKNTSNLVNASNFLEFVS